MATFTVTPIEKGIMRCRHEGPFGPEDVQTLSSFLEDYHGKLLVDLTATAGEECARHMKGLRPMMPTTAIFGAELEDAVLEILESYYTHPVKVFATEDEALTWLREQ